ncbi:MAG: hypothetical protein ACFN4D_05965, partial [Cardiobacterium sp.]
GQGSSGPLRSGAGGGGDREVAGANVCGFVNFTWWRFLIHSGGYGGSPYAAIARHTCIFSGLRGENATLLPRREKICAEIS